MKILRRIAFLAAVFITIAIGSATPASAQATRTWVSGVGDDVNPCSRTAPCKTFAGAISKTAAGGEINCLDPGGFGAVTIIKSMTINCIYTEGGVLAGGNGIVLNMPAVTDVAFLRGLDIFGVNPPTNGIRFINNGSLHVEDVTIRRFNASGSFGISYQPSGVSQLTVRNSTIAENGSGATGGGILIQPTGAGGSARVHLDNVTFSRNANQNIRIDSTGNTGNGITVTIDDCTITDSATGMNVVAPAATATIGVMLTHSLISGHTGTGIVTNGGTITMRVGNTTITGNAQGVLVAGGSIMASFGTNRLFGNPTVGVPNNGAFTGAPTPEN